MITADLVLNNLPASSKKQVFERISQEAAGLFFGNPDAVLHALLDRERLGTTGIGNGVAIPHIKIEGLKRMYGVLARLEQPVDYKAMDDKPVDIVFMLLAPAGEKTTQHLKALAQVSRFLKDNETCGKIRSSACKDSLEAVLTEWLKRQAA